MNDKLIFKHYPDPERDGGFFRFYDNDGSPLFIESINFTGDEFVIELSNHWAGSQKTVKIKPYKLEVDEQD